MDKLIITAAICGAEVTKDQNPNVPYTIQEIAMEAESAYQPAHPSFIFMSVRMMALRHRAGNGSKQPLMPSANAVLM